MKELQLPIKGGDRKRKLENFSENLLNLSKTIGFKVSARGWGYLLEQFGLITKAEFDKVERAINTCRKQGYLPIDFTAEEESRQFSGVEEPDNITPSEHLIRTLKWSLRCESFYTPDWWDGEDYYIQVIVEKIDLKTLFEPVCQNYHIPIATSKGWSSMLQRAEYSRRFLEAEDNGLQSVLLYCGDHDPDGLRISDFLRSNLEDLKDVIWEDGFPGYDPIDLTIERFGLDYDFIIDNNLSWINNLITGSKKDLGSPNHKNHFMPYVQEYIEKYGKRKCEANALVINPNKARNLIEDTIISYLGENAIERFEQKEINAKNEIEELRNEKKLKAFIEAF